MSVQRPHALLVLALAGCSGLIDGGAADPDDPAPGAVDPSAPATPGTPPGSPPGTAPPPPGVAPPLPNPTACQEMPPPVSPLRRLTRDQFNATVRDLLGDTRSAGNRFPVDDQGDDVFVSTAGLIVTPAWAEQAINVSEELAQGALANLSRIVPCNPQTAGEAACAKQLIEVFGKRAYRRPLDAAEVMRLQKIFALGAANGGFNHGVELVVRAMLQSPFFLYRLELGRGPAADGALQLSPHEVASRLSYLLWGSMPDAALTAAADAGKLGPQEVATHARRMLGDARAKSTISAFHLRWFGLDDLNEVSKDTRKYREWTGGMVQSVTTESSMFIDHVLWKADGKLDTLMSAPVAYVNTNVARLYGVTPPTGENYQLTQLDVSQRHGVLTNVGVLAVHTFADESAAIHRGKFVRERLLCTTPPDPPSDLMIVPPVPRAGIPTRQRLQEHSANPACQPCHALMDPIGFAFESYDGIGRFRTTDQGKPVDNLGAISGSGDADGMVRGVPELSRKLLASSTVRDCVVRTVLLFAQGPEASGDVCARSRMRAAFEASGRDLRELVISVSRTDGFQIRRLAPGEVSP